MAMPRFGERQQRVDQRLRPCLRCVDHARPPGSVRPQQWRPPSIRRAPRAPCSRRPAARRAAATAFSGSKYAAEGVDEQHGRVGAGGVSRQQRRRAKPAAMPRRAAQKVSLRHCGQLALGRQPQPALGSSQRAGHRLRRLSSHGSRLAQRRVVGQAARSAGPSAWRRAALVAARGTSIFMRAMSTPVGQSRLQPLQPTHRSSASCTASPVKRVGPELARQRQAQRVGAAAREVLLVARDAVARAHRAGVELAAVAVVVAHLHRLGEAAGRVAAAAGRAGRFGDRVVLHVPRRPVERGLDRRSCV